MSERLNSPKVLIVLNHLHALDPPMALGSMPKEMYKQLQPYAFMTNPRYLSIPVLGSVLKAIGCFPSKEYKSMSYGLNGAKELLSKGSRVVIFPEGTVVKPGRNYRNHNGVAVLANEPDVKVLPIHIRQRRKKTTIFGTNRIFRNIDIIYGEPFDGHGMSADEIMDRVYALEP